MGTVVPQPVAVLPDSGRVLKSLGVTHKLTSDQTGGAFYLCEAVFGPESGSPLHIHHNEDEVIYVLNGEIEIRLGQNNLHIPVGGIVHLASTDCSTWRSSSGPSRWPRSMSRARSCRARNSAFVPEPSW